MNGPVRWILIALPMLLAIGLGEAATAIWHLNDAGAALAGIIPGIPGGYLTLKVIRRTAP